MLYVNAKTWSCRPSELLQIEDGYVAYCLDEAVGHFGRTLEAELEKAGSNAKDENEAEWKQRRVLSNFLDDEEEKPQRGQFADPVAMFN